MTICDRAVAEIKHLGESLTAKDYADYLQEVFDEVEMMLDAAQEDADLE
jgi:hypothetical protein